eukprot:Pompholyxophrys_punicea_v1_NODE_6_length_8794_cov_7.233894.p12 type:complete len:110 gc:universal NODE_6_length_8794_cov_7.233894:5279-4950(-)
MFSSHRQVRHLEGRNVELWRSLGPTDCFSVDTQRFSCSSSPFPFLYNIPAASLSAPFCMSPTAGIHNRHRPHLVPCSNRRCRFRRSFVVVMAAHPTSPNGETTPFESER